MRHKGSELILNSDRSIYHLQLLPHDIADTIITVGDPDRVQVVSNHFDTVELRKGRREFKTHTGVLKGKRLTVISTGIGTDNVDIVLNEVDALANIDLRSGNTQPVHRPLSFIRLGTSGALHPGIAPGAIVLAKQALGLDGLLHFYRKPDAAELKIQGAFTTHTAWPAPRALPYFAEADPALYEQMVSEHVFPGFTVTSPGFYGPQGRTLRLEPMDTGLAEKLASFEHNGMKITNLEMETAGIYGLSRLMGHRAVSLSCILANRVDGNFSKDPEKAIENLITYALDKITA